MKRIPGSEHYWVTKDGRVWSEKRIGAKGGWMRLRKNSTGRLLVCLHENGKRQEHKVHQLVLETYVGPCPPGMEACHFPDRDPRNNRLENLRWDTRSANQLDAVKHGTQGGLRNRGKGKLSELDVRWIEYLCRAGIAYNDLSEVYRVSIPHICGIAHHRFWKHLWRNHG